MLQHGTVPSSVQSGLSPPSLKPYRTVVALPPAGVTVRATMRLVTSRMYETVVPAVVVLVCRSD